MIIMYMWSWKFYYLNTIISIQHNTSSFIVYTCTYRHSEYNSWACVSRPHCIFSICSSGELVGGIISASILYTSYDVIHRNIARIFNKSPICLPSGVRTKYSTTSQIVFVRISNGAWNNTNRNKYIQTTILVVMVTAEINLFERGTIVYAGFWNHLNL